MGSLEQAITGHPRLYFTANELARLRDLRSQGVHKLIWENLKDSAEWCLKHKPRTEWIAPVADDPNYLNLYDRFYAQMHDMAIMEHLAFAYAYSADTRYSDAGKAWTTSCCHVWSREADGEPDMGKAYAVTRMMKGVAVSYDLLYDQLSAVERDEILSALHRVGHKYYVWYQENPELAGPEQNSHHGSVEAASMGVTALAILGEVPEAAGWLDIMVGKHTDHLLEHGLTPTGTSEYGSNFWASTLHYRFFFLDALRRVTGLDLLHDREDSMPGLNALAAVAGHHYRGDDESDQSVMIALSYGQLNYWSPALLFLAREYRRPIYQHLALWDKSMGAIARSRYVTPNGEEGLFEFGGYVYAWYDPTVEPGIEPNLPYSVRFLDVNEAYMRDSFEHGGIVVGTKSGSVSVYAGEQSVMTISYDLQHPPEQIDKIVLTDDGRTAIIRCGRSESFAFEGQTFKLRRLGALTLTRETTEDVSWWCQGDPTRDGDTLRWPDGTTLEVTLGRIISYEQEGYYDPICVGFGLLTLADPTPMRHPLVTARPQDGLLEVEVRLPGATS